MNFYVIFKLQKLFLKIHFHRDTKTVEFCHKVQPIHTLLKGPYPGRSMEILSDSY